jgi:hypothetical protein
MRVRLVAALSKTGADVLAMAGVGAGGFRGGLDAEPVCLGSGWGGSFNLQEQ